MPHCNTTLIDLGDDAVKTETPLWKGFTFHHFGLILSAVFGVIACIIAFILIFLHATHYSKPWEQRYIIRILLMLPIYAIVSFVSYFFYRYAIYWQVIRDCYEAFAIASFFTLLCHYLEPTLHEQKNYFRQVTPRNWVLPINWLQHCTGGRNKGPFRIPRSGLTWFNIVWVGVFQYCAIRVIFTFVALITQFFRLYCESSLSPAFSHIWVLVFEGVAVSIAMYCLIQFYIQLKEDLAAHRPFLKILCIKLVIFFSFWQSLVISFLASTSGPLKPSKYISYADIQVGIPAMLLCIEMAFFAVMHIWAFSHKPYRLSSTQNAGDPNMYYRGFFRALIDALNPWDIVKALARSARWMFVGYKKREQDESYTMKATSADSHDESFDYHAPTTYPTSSNGGSNAELGVIKSNNRPYDDHDGTALLANAQTDPKAGGDAHSLYRPGQSYEDGGDLSLAPTNISRDDYFSNGSYPPQQGIYNSRDGNPYRYDAPPPIPSSNHASSGAGSDSPVVVSPMQTAAHPFAGATQPGRTVDYEHVDTGYHAAANAPSTNMPQAHDQQWNFFGGATGAAPPPGPPPR